MLREEQWRALERAHEQRVDELTAGHRQRSAHAEKHPVEDFLFTYYSHRPSQLRRWHPGADVVLLGERARDRLGWRWYREVDTQVDGQVVRGIGVDADAFGADRGTTVAFVRDLVTATAGRPAQLGCFGLHEWAMVYGLAEGEQRHDSWPLRLGHAGTDAVVESRPIRCSHYDAFRFFTERARPLNSLQPSRSQQVDLEQPGCLHAGMDLYKWAYKLSPLTPSALVLQCFELARDIRVLDMQASPYDLVDLGYEPVRIETPEGRAEYAARQRAFAERARPLRAALLHTCSQAAHYARP
ncbi:MAG TPA: 3-methyladenine DNA glycosylase [Actinomycetales bacterium]|nr:3-methyladenine DNA glycosylase [Actinomycetales bacterium]